MNPGPGIISRGTGLIASGRRGSLVRLLVALPLAIVLANTTLFDASRGHLLASAEDVETPLVVDAAWVEAALEAETENLRILDLSTLEMYRRGHVPGAVHAWWQDTMDWNDPVYGTLLPPGRDQSERRALLEDLGIDDDTTVVAYDDARGAWAARMVWFLRFLGHGRAALLDGGYRAWLEGGGVIDRGQIPADAQGDLSIDPQQGWHLSTARVIDALVDPRTQLVDVRSLEELKDDVDGSVALGRIPGSISLPWTSTINPGSGRIRSSEELGQLLADASISPDRPVILYSTFGVGAAHTWLVLKLMGYRDVQIYDRGWAEWSSRAELPRELLP